MTFPTPVAASVLNAVTCSRRTLPTARRPHATARAKTTDAGKRFIEAWKRARNIVDTGGGHSGTPPTPPTSPATPKP